MLLYQAFFRKFGVLRITSLVDPRRNNLLDLNFPRNTILHFWPESLNQVGPDTNYMYFRNIKRPIMMGHVTENGASLGNPRLLAIQTQPLIRQYHQKHRRYRILDNPTVLNRDSVTYYVSSYSLIQKRYRYIRTPLTNYHSWYNSRAAMFKRMNELADQLPNRNQFIIVPLPTLLPGLTDFIRDEKDFTQASLKRFNSPEKFFLLHLWRWLTDNRSNSLFNLINKRNLNKINIIFTDSGKWSMINLGRIDHFRAVTDSEIRNLERQIQERKEASLPTMELEDVVKQAKKAGGLPGNTLAKFLLRGLLVITSSRTMVSNITANVSDQVTDDEFEEYEEKPTGLKDSDEDDDSQITNITDPESLEVLEDFKKDDDDNETSEDVSEEELLELESLVSSDLSKLEELNEKNDLGIQLEEPISEVVVRGRSFEDGMLTVMDQYANSGRLTAAQYKRLERLASSYKEIKAPDGKGTLAEFSSINPEDLVIDDKPLTNDEAPQGMLNPSIATSTLNDFDQQYVSKVLQKDVANMVLSIQRSGYAVVDYTVVHNNTIQGNFDQYSFKIIGVDGASQTLHFTLPTIDRNGVFTVNGVKYKYPKQKGFALPIKKISPEKVALTSYYSKIFVVKPRLRVNNYGIWLSNAIKAKAISEDGSNIKITNLELEEVFKESDKTPIQYATLGMYFRGFILQNSEAKYYLSFDYDNRAEFLTGKPDAPLESIEMDGRVVIGKDPSRAAVLVIDKSGYVGELIKGKPGVRDLGSLESFLGLNANKAPTEFTAIQIMGQEIPIGMILGYKKGFKNLIKELKPSHRIVPIGQHVKLLPHEYQISFSDETWVFSRKEVYNTLIISGLNKYRTGIKQYTVNDFNQSDVYINILEDNGVSVRFVNEIELLYQMFIDPITEELLVQMGEPTDFEGLLRRSTELLTDAFVPKTKDRLRGYERFAGAIYSEIVRSLKLRNVSQHRNSKPLDFSPFAVQRAIMTDSSKMQVKDINPIEDLKQQELTKSTGTGGRSTVTMTKETRKLDPMELGIESEATVDSANVGINAYTPANPKLTSVRGLYEPYDNSKDDPSRLVSTSALISVAGDKDDLFC